MEFVRFSATVNGTSRAVAFPIELMPAWFKAYSCRAWDWDEGDLEAAERIVMNDEPLYREFYSGCTDNDYNAVLEDVSIEVGRD